MRFYRKIKKTFINVYHKHDSEAVVIRDLRVSHLRSNQISNLSFQLQQVSVIKKVITNEAKEICGTTLCLKKNGARILYLITLANVDRF